MRTRKGFTLVEIMIVVAIIALLSAIAIPNLLRARLSANEAAAAAACKTIAAAQIHWRATNSDYATLAELSGATPPYIDATLGSGAKQGYEFELTTDDDPTQFHVYAFHTGEKGADWYIDEAGVLCRAPQGTGDPDHMGGVCTAPYEDVD
jgi:prepilin-type N-terminal cleavage/methylation domain-containing protein